MTPASTPTPETENSGTVPPTWIIKLMTRAHVLLNRLSGGKLFNTLMGDEVCFVRMTGARSGNVITIPLMYVPYEEGVLLVASNQKGWHANALLHI